MMDFQSVDPDSRHFIRHRQPLFASFPGKTENQMRADMYRSVTSEIDGSQECCVIVTAIDATEGIVIDRFHPELQRNEDPSRDLLNHRDLVFIHAVRPRSNG